MLRSGAHLAVLRQLVLADEELRDHASRVDVFFKNDQAWMNGASKPVTATFWQRAFARALLEPSFRVFADTLVKGLSTTEIAVAARLKSASQGQASVVERIIRRIVSQAEDRYAAEFDKLTDAPGRRNLQRHLEGLARRTAEFSSEVTDRRLAVMMLDLDNFKQANDSQGHDFGDALLQVTAWRLKQWSHEKVKSGIVTECCAGRWGGEEFLVVGLFQNDPKVVAESAAELVERFEKPAMPDAKKEVPLLRRLNDDPKGDYPTPVVPVTASLGWTWMTSAVSEADITAVVTRAVTEADAAMFRAKQIGKNKSVAFAEIASSHGRVLAHRTDAGVVIIDIGEFVGVRKGDEFIVLPDDFARRSKYVVKDGRTQRSLGNYPAMPVATIKVAESPARDVSFCVIKKMRLGVMQLSERAHLRKRSIEGNGPVRTTARKKNSVKGT